MDIKEYLADYRKKVDRELEKYFEEKLSQAEKNHPLLVEAVEIVRNFVMSGGKRVRPAIMYYSYLANGGKDEDEIIKTSMSIELTHAFLLIHDDIIDKDEFRHNVETVHTRYRKKAEAFLAPKKIKKDAVHFGNSMALCVGDLTSSMANEVLFRSNYSAEKIIQALDALSKIVYRTIPGEMIDVEMEFFEKVSEEDILKMHEGKTAFYTFEGPIHLGWILAGNDSKKNLNNFSKYALAVGKAFQIRDDILGVFGDEKKLGKPVGSDIIEGKQTLLLLKAREKGAKSQREIIKKYVKKNDLTEEELEKVRNVIVETGSLDYSNKLAKKMVDEGVKYLEGVNFKNENAKDFFYKIAEYIISRQV